MSGISVSVPVQMYRAIQKISACHCKGLSLSLQGSRLVIARGLSLSLQGSRLVIARGLGLSLQGSQLVIARVFSEAISILRDIS